jgi:hypothetical protein
MIYHKPTKCQDPRCSDMFWSYCSSIATIKYTIIGKQWWTCQCNSMYLHKRFFLHPAFTWSSTLIARVTSRSPVHRLLQRLQLDGPRVRVGFMLLHVSAAQRPAICIPATNSLRSRLRSTGPATCLQRIWEHSNNIVWFSAISKVW